MSLEKSAFVEDDKVTLNKNGISPIIVSRLKQEGFWGADGVVETVTELPEFKNPAGYRMRKLSCFEYVVFFEGLGQKIIHESYLSHTKYVKKQKCKKSNL